MKFLGTFAFYQLKIYRSFYLKKSKIDIAKEVLLA